MPVLNREEYLQAINERVGNDTSDEALAFIENMTDTYAHLEEAGSRVSEDGVDWEQKYYDNDRAWREKYQNRFFSGGRVNAFGEPEPEETPDESGVNENIHVADLFKPE